MNNKPIGIFDSGIGGLTVVKSIIDCLPNEDIIFFGDTANVPYGNKKEEEIIRLVKYDAAFLNTFDLKAMVIACNTADSVARSAIEGRFDYPVLGVIEPTSQKAVRATHNNKIGIIATPATVTNGAYIRSIHSIRREIEVYQQPCEKLVPLIEDGKFLQDGTEMIELLKEYLQPLISKNIDTLILGCTHYQLLSEHIQKLYPELRIVSSSLAVGEYVVETLKKKGLVSEENEGKREYYVSKDPERIKEKARLFMPLEEIKLKP